MSTTPTLPARSRRDRATACSICRRSKAQASPSADRKSTRLNSSHVKSSYAVFCLKKQIQKLLLCRMAGENCQPSPVTVRQSSRGRYRNSTTDYHYRNKTVELMKRYTASLTFWIIL